MNIVNFNYKLNWYKRENVCSLYHKILYTRLFSDWK